MFEPSLAGFLYLVGFSLIAIGVLIIVINILYSSRRGEKSDVGGIILIGPFPIIFGTGSRILRLLTILSLLLFAIILVIVFLSGYFAF